MSHFTLPVVSGKTREGRCGRCRAQIVIALVGRVGRIPAREWRFDRRPVDEPSRTTNPETRVTFEFWPKALLHTCPSKPKPTTPASSARPAFDPVTGEGRLL